MSDDSLGALIGLSDGSERKKCILVDLRITIP